MRNDGKTNPWGGLEDAKASRSNHFHQDVVARTFFLAMPTSPETHLPTAMRIGKATIYQSCISLVVVPGVDVYPTVDVFLFTIKIANCQTSPLLF